VVRRLFVPPDHVEWKPFGFLSIFALNVLLTFTRFLDSMVSDKQDLTKMVFVRDSAAESPRP
jgi:hypothetical protein